jgi:hypothetical protein
MRATPRGQRELEAAITSLIQSQAALMRQQSAFFSAQAKNEVELIDLRRRQSGVEDQFEQVKAILLRHEEALRDLHDMIAKLPDAIRQKIGFKPTRG